MSITATELRSNLYRLLDQVLATGEPLLISRKGRQLRIEPDRPEAKLDRLIRREGVIKGDPDDLVHVDWSGEWRP
jgi:antitoxin (DNA-binding transcriptional repressor) of toxin-antitoxin stability system